MGQDYLFYDLHKPFLFTSNQGLEIDALRFRLTLGLFFERRSLPGSADVLVRTRGRRLSARPPVEPGAVETSALPGTFQRCWL